MPNKPWLSHYPLEVPHLYAYPKHNLARFLVESAQIAPSRIALDFLGKRITFGELLDSSYRFANALRSQGVRKGDRVAIMLPNCPQAVISYYGTLLMGGVVVMTNPLYMERELRLQLEDADVRAIVTLDVLLERVRKATKDQPIEHIFVTGIKDYLTPIKKTLYLLKSIKEGTAAKVAYEGNVASFRMLLKQSSAEPCDEPVDAERDLALIQYTGGTTGFSKGVKLTHLNLVANTIQTRLWMHRASDENTKFLSVLPFFHVFGMTVALNLGIYMTCEQILIPRFEINQVLKTIHKKRPTAFPGAPTMYIAIINHPEIMKYDLSSISICISGAAPLPREVQERFEAITGGKLIEGYGLTEASPVTHANNIWENRKFGSIGIPLPDTEVRVVDPVSFEELPIGEIGELAIRGPQVMQGYWNRPEDTAKTLKDGWLLTGDLGRMDEEGFFYIMDRRKDLIIAGGYNVYPREVEEVLFEHPDVEEAVVVGVKDPYRGETVKAYVKLRLGSASDAEALKLWCKERLAAYKVPKLFEFRDSFPKTLVGKVLRRILIEEEDSKGA
jgi:long-chain acyl-CoA synthetase